MMKKRWIFILAAVFVLSGGLLMSCEKETLPENRISGEMTGVFRKTEIVFPADYAISMGETAAYANGLFTVKANKVDSDGSQFVDIYKVFTFDSAGGNLTEVGESTEPGTSSIEPVEEGARVDNHWVTADETTVFCEVVRTDTDFSMNLSARDREGAVLFCADIPGMLDYDIMRDKNRYGTSGEIFTYLDVETAETESGSLYLVLTSEGLCALNPAGEMQWRQTGQQNPTSIGMTDAGLIYLYGEAGSQSLRTVSLSDGTVSDPIELPEVISGAGGGEVMMPAGADPESNFDFYVKNALALWGVLLETGDDGTVTCVPTEVINWVNSNLAPSDVKGLCIADAKTIAATVNDALSDEQSVLYLLTMVPEDEIVEKEIITLAKLSDHWLLQYAVKQFNEASDTHRIVVTDFTQYEDVSQRKLMMDAEMAAGRVPDIILIAPSSSDDTTVDSYMRSGVLCDLTPLMQADETFDYDDLLGYVTKPYQMQDGTQPVFPLTPTVTTQLGTAEYFTGPITAEEMLEMYRNLPEGVQLTRNRNHMRFDILDSCMEDFIDWDNNTCSFADGRFAAILEEVKAIPMQESAGMLSKTAEIYAAIQEGTLRLYEVNNMRTLRQWVDTKHGMGGSMVPVGYPNAEGKLYIDSNSGEYFAITEASEHKAEAFDLLECFMYIMNNRDYGAGVTYFGADVDRQLAEFEGMTIVRNAPGSGTLYPDEKAEGMEGEHTKVTEADAAEFKAFLNGIDGRLRTDTPVYQIYSEEIWNENRTAEEIADVIQSRVAIYLAEIQ